MKRTEEELKLGYNQQSDRLFLWWSSEQLRYIVSEWTQGGTLKKLSSGEHLGHARRVFNKRERELAIELATKVLA